MLAAYISIVLSPLSIAVDLQHAECIEGECRPSDRKGLVQVCASNYWQDQPRGLYSCINATLCLDLPERPSFTAANADFGSHLADDSTFHSPKAQATPSIPSAIATEVQGYTSNSIIGQTGYSFCSQIKTAYRSDDFGSASYTPNGKMASMYYRQGGAFRCDVEEPGDGMYVALWTPYDASLQSQPKPVNCGQKMTFRNPYTGTTAEAVVVDRCAGCAGVNHQASDATTPDNLVNGATVDLSESLWNVLYSNAASSVYDIEYDGTPWPGSLQEPGELVNPRCWGH